MLPRRDSLELLALMPWRAVPRYPPATLCISLLTQSEAQEGSVACMVTKDNQHCYDSFQSAELEVTNQRRLVAEDVPTYTEIPKIIETDVTLKNCYKLI